MSLLMEALRKAEEAKRRMQQEEQAAAGREPRDAAHPFPAGNSKGNSGSAFTLEEREPDLTPEYIRDNFTSPPEDAAATGHQDEYATAHEPNPVAEPEPEPEYARQTTLTPSSPALARRQQRAAAASVFTAKQHPARNRNTLTILVLVMLLIIPTGGGLLWYLQSASTSSIGLQPALANYDLSSRELAGANAVTLPVAPDATAAPAGQDPGIEATRQTAAAEPPATVEDSSTPEPEPEAAAVALLEEDAVNPVAESIAQSPADVAAAVPAAVAPAITGTPPGASPAQPALATNSILEISRTRSSNQVNPNLVLAYESLQAGDLTNARRQYQELLGTLPNNRDALLGLASINLREGDPAGARGLYARLLQLNPRDPLAHTGLLQTMQASDPAEHERTLKSLISRYPDVAQLTLALGNHYASQQRWSEAQGAYYNALLTASRGTGGPVHPDYAFNLAVSLEQLNQPKAALDYYRRAQALAAETTPGFDRQLLNSRLEYLEQAQP